jgi:hypothetical protein
MTSAALAFCGNVQASATGSTKKEAISKSGSGGSRDHVTLGWNAPTELEE